MLYNPAQISALYDTLNQEWAKLEAGADLMEKGRAQMQAGWAGQGDEGAAIGSFNAVYASWAEEFSNTKVVLNQVAKAVESGLNRALGTDGKIGDGFAGIG
ncbi:hypothetical protein [Nocardia caishijiensis]|nr:hypothetical protein [Nocardia caishijiensis]